MMWKISDNKGRNYTAIEYSNTYTVSKEKIPKGVEYIDFIAEEFDAKSGDRGYYVIADYEKKGSRLCFLIINLIAREYSNKI